jgi:hypothetical protein
MRSQFLEGIKEECKRKCPDVNGLVGVYKRDWR